MDSAVIKVGFFFFLLQWTFQFKGANKHAMGGLFPNEPRVF